MSPAGSYTPWTLISERDFPWTPTIVCDEAPGESPLSHPIYDI
jgi:hypothetical protein